MSSSVFRRSQHLPPKSTTLFLYSLSSTITSPPPPPDPLITDAVSILNHHRSKSRWSNLLSLSPNGFSPSQFSQISIKIRNNPHLALHFYDFTRRHSLCIHNLLSLSTITHILARSRLKSHARDLIRLSIRLSSSTLRKGDVFPVSESEPLLKVFESLVKTYNQCGSAPFVFDLLLKSCLESKKFDGCVDIVKMLLSKGISPNVSTLNALVSDIGKHRGACSGYAIYRLLFGLDGGINRDMKGVVRVSPNVHTFNSLMVCFYREGESEKVREIWREMEELNCEANSYSYSVMMSILCDEGQMRESAELLEKIREKGLDCDIVTYNTMIGGFCKIGEIVKAEDLFREMGLNGIESSCVTYEHLIKGYCKAGDIDTCMVLYKDMRRKDFRPESSTVNVLVKGLCDTSRVFEGLKIMKAAMKEFGFCPTDNCYELVIKSLCKEKKMPEALKLQAEMVGRGFEPNSTIYGIFIDGYVKQGNNKMAELLRTEMLLSVKAQEG